MGVVAYFHQNYGDGSTTSAPNIYAYSIIPLNYYCDGNAINIAGEVITYFAITANRFDVDVYDGAQGGRLEQEGFNVIPDMPIAKNGYLSFPERESGKGSGMGEKSKSWLVTYDGKLPYAYVTKKEFLEKRKLNLTSQMESSAAGYRDVLANKEIEKKYKETEYKNDPDKLKKYMEMDYLNIKNRYEKFLTDNAKEYKPAFDKINSQLKMSASELNQQAIVKMDPADALSYLFTDDNDPFGEILIKPNPGYFNPKLPKSSPQFFWIYVRVSLTEPISARFMTDIMPTVDFALLKNMLGK